MSIRTRPKAVINAKELFEFLLDAVEAGWIGVIQFIYPGIHGKKKHRRVYAFAQPRVPGQQPPAQQAMISTQQERCEKQVPRRRKRVHPAASGAHGGGAGLYTLFETGGEKR